MTKEAKKALEAVRDALHEAVGKITQADYREVLEQLAADIEGRLDALNEETGGDE